MDDKKIHENQKLAKKNITAIIKPTEACNLRCKYCYIPEDNERGFMDEKTLENLTRELINVPTESVKFLWHGGEPLLAGLGFYEKAVEYQKKYKRAGVKVNNAIQTNATLINEEAIDFFKKNEFSVGISLDGPREINNLTRVYADGRGSFDDIMKSIELMKSKDLRFGVITVLTRDNMNKTEEIYNFFKDNNLRAKVNPLICCGRTEKYIDELSISPKDMSDTILKYFDLWIDDKNPADLDPLTCLTSYMLGNSSKECCYSGNCFSNFVSIAANGDIYPCGRFVGNSDFKMGNINNDSMKDVFQNHPLYKEIEERQEKLKDCKKCDVNSLCRGGCSHHAYVAYGTINERDYFCEGRKLLYAKMASKILEKIKEVKI